MRFSGQGKLYSAERDTNGNPLAFRFLGDVSELKIQPKTTTIEHQEHTSGQRLTDDRLLTGKSVEVSVTMDEWLADNLADGLYGVSSALAGGPVTGEDLPNPLALGDYVRLAQPDISALSLEDSTVGTPLVPALGTDYSIENAKTGLLKIISDLSGFVQPLIAAYTSAGGTNIAMFTTAPPERWLYFAGLNTADSDTPILIELYKVQLDPIGEIDPISDTFSTLTMVGSALYDVSKEADAILSQFGRIVQLAA